MEYIQTDDEIDPKEISLRSSARLVAGKYRLRELNFKIEIKNNSIDSFTVFKGEEEWMKAVAAKIPSDNI